MILERLIGFTLRRKGLIIAVTACVVLLGVTAFMRLPIDAFPDVTNIQVEIVSTAPGLSAFEIERFVTYPIETTMRGLPGVVQMRSVTKFGISVVTLVFKDNVDIYFARQLVFEKLSEASKKIPEGVETSLGPVATAMGEVVQYTLDGSEPEEPEARVRYLTDLRTLQEWTVAPLLKNVPGVNEINSFGGTIRQVHVIVDPGRMAARGVSLNEVVEALRLNNVNVGGNTIDRLSEQWIVRGIGMIRSEEDIRRIVLKSPGGIPALIGDVAEVRAGQAVRQGAALKNGRETVGGIVMMLRGENTRDVVSRIQQKIEEINGNGLLPGGVRIVPYYQRSDIIRKCVETVTKALGEGAVLVLFVLYLFLRNLRGAAVVLLALPLSLLLTFMVMKSVGLDANLMSLGGLAISIGMIVDATIIQVENVQRHLVESGKTGKNLQTVLRAVLEVRKPSILGEGIIAMTFLPILTLQGLEGKMFAPLALTVAVALASSLLLSIFVVPALCLLVLRPGREKDSPVMKAVRRGYFPVLRWSMQKRGWILLAVCLLFAGACFLIPRLGTEFMPVMDEGAFDMDVQMLPGISLDQALQSTALAHARLGKFPELETVVSRTGQTGIALEARGVDKTGYVGVYKPRSQWTSARNSRELTEKMRESLSSIPGMVFSFSQPVQCRIDELVAGTRAQLIVKLFGDDVDSLKAAAREIAETLSNIRGVTDLIVEQTTGQPYLSISVDRGAISRHGISVRDVFDAVEIAVGGKAATQIYEANKSFDVVVRFPEKNRDSKETIGRILVNGSRGYGVPLREVARLSEEEGPVQISREDGQRRIGIELNVRGRDIGGFVAEAKKAIRETVRLPAGYYTGWGGQFENQQRAMKRLAVITPLGIAMIFLLLFMTFGSARLALLVIFNLPFALIGGVIALFATGQYLSVPASVGFIVLFGVAVLNGVVLVSCISQLRRDLPLHQAVLKGCENRLRPVLMTASIAIFSLIPMLFATGPGSEIQRPLAVVVVGGLFTSTVLTLLVLPAMYGWFEGKKN